MPIRNAVLGLKLNPYHDTGAALVAEIDGRLRVTAISQERLDRKKHSRAFPLEAVNYCMENLGCRFQDLTLVVGDYINRPTVDDNFEGGSDPDLEKKKTFYQQLLEQNVPFAFAEHHLCHAASAYFATDWGNASAVVIDGHGSNFETQSIFSCAENGITKLACSRRPGIGWMYTAVTETLLGFGHLQEGKLMGLAGWASANSVFKQLFAAREDPFAPHETFYPQFLAACEVPWRLATPKELKKRQKSEPPTDTLYAQYAQTAQEELEERVLQLVRHAHRLAPNKRLCYSGGVALNIVANRRITDLDLFEEVFIQPAASDSGIPLGAALLGYYGMRGGETRWTMDDAFLGRHYTEDVIRAAANSWEGLHYPYDEAVVCRLLANNYLAAWHEGASEFGPRALGHRSILCSPLHPNMKAYLNREVKHREMFRPFAPIVAEEAQTSIFDLGMPSPYMLHNARVLDGWAQRIPAVVHADGTARLQTITREKQPRLHSLLYCFARENECPVLLNTSLNLAGEPIMETPFDSVDLFSRSRLDFLVLDEHLLTKKPVESLLNLKNNQLDEL